MKEITLQPSLDPLVTLSHQEKALSGDSEKGFSEILQKSIAEVNALQKEADQSVQDLAMGTGGDLHATMIALEKAELSFKLMMQVRNKIVAAYEEIMRMQV